MCIWNIRQRVVVWLIKVLESNDWVRIFICSEPFPYQSLHLHLKIFFFCSCRHSDALYLHINGSDMFCWKRMLFASSESDQWCEEWPEISKFRWILKLENEFIWLHFVPENCKLILNIFRHSDLKFFHLQIWLIFCNPGRRWSDETLSQYCYSYFWLSANPHSTLRARPGWKRQCNRGSDWFQTKKKLKNKSL